jgi:hypothetical protein
LPRQSSTLPRGLEGGNPLCVNKGGISTLGVDSTFGGIRSGLGRRHGRRISTSKEDVSTAPGPSPPGPPLGTRPKQTAGPAAPQPQPAGPRGHQPGSWPRQPDSRVGPASGRPGQAPAAAATPPWLGKSPAPGPTKFLLQPTPPLSMLTPLPPASAHRRAAEGSFTEQEKLGRQGRPSRGTPTPPGYGYLTRHLPHEATHTWLSGSASRQASPGARNEEKTWYCAQIPRCSGADSHNEQTPALKVPLQMKLRFHSRRYEQPPTLEGLRGDKIPGGSPPPTPAAATMTSTPGGQTTAAMTSGQTLLR